MLPEGIQIGSYLLRFYGILIVLGAVAATWLASRLIRRRAADTIDEKELQAPVAKIEAAQADAAEGGAEEPVAGESVADRETRIEAALEKEGDRLGEMAWDIMPWALLGGVIGARLWHVMLPPASMIEIGHDTIWYLTHPLDILYVWNGGLGIPGAVIGGFIALWIYCRKKEVPLGFWVDAIAPGLALAQAIGRWGNFFNQELYGAPTDLPWKLFIAPQYRLTKYQNVAYYHPLFLYESLWNLANMGLLLWLGRRYPDRLKPWDLFFVYMIFYGVGRFLLEFLRLDPAPVGLVDGNQIFMAIVAVLGAVALFVNHRKGANNL
jgi:phosphatidylglycerol---prolipoprotein diacylglyceryl transferase